MAFLVSCSLISRRLKRTGVWEALRESNMVKCEISRKQCNYSPIIFLASLVVG